MKLRILGDSIRIRIQQQELADLEQHGTVYDAIHFGIGSVLSYEVQSSESVHALDAHYEPGRIVILIPKADVKEMVQTDRVGVSHEKPLDAGNTLKILIEKDFKCLTPRSEDADAFPHPDEAQGSC